MIKKVELEFGGRPFVAEIGRFAQQADGSAFISHGETAVLVTSVSVREPYPDTDFVPLTVDYQEKLFAAGKIPGGYFKREGRPSEKEVLTCRLIDRSLRPLFPKGYSYETQIVATVVSADQDNDPDVVAITGASLALQVSDIPFSGPIAGARVGRINGGFIINPTEDQITESDMDIVVVASREAIVMVEGSIKELPEDVVLEAILFGQQAVTPLLDMQDELTRNIGISKRPFTPGSLADTVQEIEARISQTLLDAMRIPRKKERGEKIEQIKQQLQKELGEGDENKIIAIQKAFPEVERRVARNYLVRERKRIDGRGLDEIRNVACEVGLLPRTHGSALFSRGETQALVVTTLGTKEDFQIIDALEGDQTKRFMLHYNFPPFSVGEAKPLRSPSRREIGHGALAERALLSILPSEEEFPYAIRIVSDILESNGSSSMATVCGGSLSLMDAGVPVKAPVAGIAMGLVLEGSSSFILSDILGDEDHIGDMDLKVAGTSKGITAIQMDIKVKGVTRTIFEQALAQARHGHLKILDIMHHAISAPRAELSPYAPRIVTFKIDTEKIKTLIGPGGKTIKGLQEETGVDIDVENDGTVSVASTNPEAAASAISKIKALTQSVEVGKIYLGKVKKIAEFGAFVEILPGTQGLIHISQLSTQRIKKVRDILKEGDEVLVKVLEIDRMGKVRLSRKEALGKVVPEKEHVS